jgi:deoxyribose-phosphate aldolase
MKITKMEQKNFTKIEIASLIDHTLLAPDATDSQIRNLCKEAADNQFASVCILPNYIILAKDILCGTNVKVCTVIGFPLGANVLPVKLYEMDEAIENGAHEVDIVVNNSFMKNNDIHRYEEEIILLNSIAKGLGVTTKFIIETALLTNEEKIIAAKIVSEAGADFVKTSTGFAKSGATVDDVRLLFENSSEKTLVKASGGIRDLQFTLDLINAGARRIGTSSGIKILNEMENTEKLI